MTDTQNNLYVRYKDMVEKQKRSILNKKICEQCWNAGQVSKIDTSEVLLLSHFAAQN